MRRLFLALLLFLPAAAFAQDVIHYTDGTSRNVKILSADGSSLKVGLVVSGQATGNMTIPRKNISRIEFGPDASLDAVAAAPVPGSLATARARWQALRSLLGTPESRAGEAGCLLGEILLQLDAAQQAEASAIFDEVEKGAWKVEDRQRAARGRLGVMIKQGKIEEASREAQEMERTAADPELQIETKLLLARARLQELTKLLSDNPRWSEDPPVVAERTRLLNEGLDYALYPFLFHGTKQRQAAQGLWTAHELYAAGDDNDRDGEALQDIVEIYPDTNFAGQATAALAKLSAEKRSSENSTSENNDPKN